MLFIQQLFGRVERRAEAIHSVQLYERHGSCKSCSQKNSLANTIERSEVEKFK